MSEDAAFEDLHGHWFHIAAKCGNCGIIYSATEGLTCPSCHVNRPAWATRENVLPPAGLQPQGSGRAQQYPKPDFSGHDADIAWCEDLMKLEDTRP
jgi:hypothetical protein